jgi:hypothetical protein
VAKASCSLRGSLAASLKAFSNKVVTIRHLSRNYKAIPPKAAY